MKHSLEANKNSRKNLKKINKQLESDEDLDKDEVDLTLNPSNTIKNTLNHNKSKNKNVEVKAHLNNKVNSKTTTKNAETNKNKDLADKPKKDAQIYHQESDNEEKDNVNIKNIREVEEDEEIDSVNDKSDNEQKIESDTVSQDEEEEEEKEEQEEDLENNEVEENSNNLSDKYFSNIKFEDFEIHEKTLQSLKELGFKVATEIQAKTIPLSLSGADIIGSAKTGSGKSLSFLIPAVEIVLANKNLPGTKALVLTPTRELALQLFNLSKDLFMYHKETCALIIGGANRKVEAEKLKNGASLIIATPGRLLDHMKNTKNFIYQNISILVIDEADAILKIGFEQELKEIISLLPKKRQSLLFSATINSKLDDIIRLSLKNPIFVSTKSHVATVTNLEQGYVVIEPDKKFLLLYTFLRKNPNKKIIVFFSSCKEVEFFAHLLNYVDIPVKSTHGSQKQQKRTATFFEFSNMEKGILLCTDVVQRGLDFPDVDWIIQYDPPHSKKITNY